MFIDRRVPGWDVNSRIQACEDCGTTVVLHKVSITGYTVTNGYPSYTPDDLEEDEEAPTDKYLKKTVTASWTYKRYTTKGNITVDETGSFELVYEISARTGHETLTSCTGSVSRTSYSYIRNWNEDHTDYSEVLDTTTPASWTREKYLADDGTESHWVGSGTFATDADYIGDDPAYTATKKTETGEDGTQTTELSIMNTFADTIAGELVESVSLSDFDPMWDVAINPTYVHRPRTEDLAATLAAKTAAVTTANAQLESLEEDSLPEAQEAVTDAIADRAAKQAAYETKRASFVTARALYESRAGALDYARKYSTPAQIAAAQAAYESAKSEMEEAQEEREEARIEYLSAIGYVSITRLEVRKLEVDIIKKRAEIHNLEAIKDLAAADLGLAGDDDALITAYAASGGIVGLDIMVAGNNLSPDGQVRKIRSLVGFGIDLTTSDGRYTLENPPPRYRFPYRLVTATRSADDEPDYTGGTPSRVITGISVDGTEHVAEILIPDPLDFAPYLITEPVQIDEPSSQTKEVYIGTDYSPGPDYPSTGGGLMTQKWTRGGAIEKWGFPEYGTPSNPPRFYGRETAAGGFPGCPLKGLSPKSYSGNQKYELEEIDEYTRRVEYTEAFSSDVEIERRTIMPSATDVSLPIHLEFLQPGQISSSTSRQWLTKMMCGATEIVDLQTLNLSQEVTTAQIKALVDEYADVAFPPLDVSSAQPQEDSVLFPVFKLGPCAIRYTSPDEKFYAHQKLRWRPYFIAHLSSSGDTFSFKDAAPDITIRYTELTLDIDSGEWSSEEKSVTMTDEDGEYYRMPSGQAIDVTAEDGKAVFIVDLKPPEEHRYQWYSRFRWLPSKE